MSSAITREKDVEALIDEHHEQSYERHQYHEDRGNEDEAEFYPSRLKEYDECNEGERR